MRLVLILEMLVLRFRAYLCLLTLFFCWSAYAGTGLVPSEILVKYRTKSTAGRVLGNGVALLHLDDVDRNDRKHQHLSQQERLNRALSKLRAAPDVEYAEPNFWGRFEDVPPEVAVPNDPGYGQQWWLEQVGARQSWAVASGHGITVAVIDSGVDFNHADLRNVLRADGYNFGDSNNNPQDMFGHGTFVAGIVAAQRDNAIFGSGLAPGAKILPYKINPGGSGTFTSAAVAQAIDAAIAKQAQIINMSLTIDSETQTVGAAIQRALDAGIIVVAAAGNESGPVAFPGTYPGVITVAGTNQDNTLWSVSNLGPEVAIAAPASSVVSSLAGGGFGTRGQGTSYAAPMISAAIANLLQVEPRLTASQAKALLRATARPIVNANLDFGILDVGTGARRMLPDLFPDKRQYARDDQLQLSYQLPVTSAAVDVYVAVTTPLGDYVFLPDGTWQEAATHGYVPVVKGYQSPSPANGDIWGGSRPMLTLNHYPAGTYTWKVALVNPDSLQILGTIISSPVVLQ